MRIDKIRHFLFHPFASEHSPAKTGLSIASIVALSILSGGGFTLALAYERWKERKVKVTRTTIPMPQPAKTIFKQAPKPVKKATKKTPLLNKPSRIKQKHSAYLDKFKNWAEKKEWQKIHDDHYDWWMYPVDRSSAGYGDLYAVNADDINALKQDSAFMENYREGVKIVVRAWGWDLDTNQPIDPADLGQKWNGYGVRLAKMSDSLKLFEEKELHESLKYFFEKHCLPQIKQTPISDLSWLLNTFETDPSLIL